MTNPMPKDDPYGFFWINGCKKIDGVPAEVAHDKNAWKARLFTVTKVQRHNFGTTIHVIDGDDDIEIEMSIKPNTKAARVWPRAYGKASVGQQVTLYRHKYQMWPLNSLYDEHAVNWLVGGP